MLHIANLNDLTLYFYTLYTGEGYGSILSTRRCTVAVVLEVNTLTQWLDLDQLLLAM